MHDVNDEKPEIDWSQATWAGARKVQLQRWAKLPLENIIDALEEMEQLHELLHPSVTEQK